MIVKKAVTVELDVDIVHVSPDVKKINIGEIMTEYDFDITNRTNEERLMMIANELMNSEKILIGFACYNSEDINILNKLLKKSNSSLDTVFIPSSERNEEIRLKAIADMANLPMHYIGYSEEDVNRNIDQLERTLLDIIESCKTNGIEVKRI